MHRLLLLSTVLSMACAPALGPEARELLLPSDVAVRWDAAFNEANDGVGALVPVDVMVYGARGGQPLEGVSVSVTVDGGVAWLHRPDEVSPAEPDDCVGCALAWDAWRGQYISLPDDDEGEANAMTLRTDADGLVRVMVYVDAFPTQSDGNGLDLSAAYVQDEEDLAALAVVVATDAREETLLLLPL